MSEAPYIWVPDAEGKVVAIRVFHGWEQCPHAEEYLEGCDMCERVRRWRSDNSVRIDS